MRREPDLLDIFPHAFQRRRMIGDRLPKIVDPVDAPRRFNIRINGYDLRRGFIFLDERSQISVSRQLRSWNIVLLNLLSQTI